MYFWTVSKKHFELGRVEAKAQRLQRWVGGVGEEGGGGGGVYNYG